MTDSTSETSARRGRALLSGGGAESIIGARKREVERSMPTREEDDELERDGRRVKVSILARMSGVPAATIKHYVREGLLPEPSRTSRNMAYYEVGLVPRIKRIKELQRTRFLPLKVIRQVLDESELESGDETVTATIARVLEQTAPTERRSRAELVSAGMPPTQLDFLRQAGIISPQGGAEEAYSGDDLEILGLLGAARKAGITPEMLPVTILAEYAARLRELVEVELRLYRDGVVPRAKSDLTMLTEAATSLSERLVVLLRRKMLVPMMREIAKKRASAPPPPEKARGAAKKSSARAPSKRPRKR